MSCQVGIPTPVQRNFKTTIEVGSSHLSRPEEISTVIQLTDKDVALPGTGQIARSRARVEVGRFIEKARGKNFMNAEID